MKKVLIAIAIIAFLLTIGWFLLSNKEKVKEKGIKLTTNEIWPLDLGYKGEIVTDIQKRLNKVDPTIKLVEDGELGPQTAQYLKKFVGFPLTQKGYYELAEMSA